MLHAKPIRRTPAALVCAAALLIFAAAVPSPAAEDAKAFLEIMKDASPEVRWTVWPKADQYGPTVIVPLGDRYEEADREMRQDIKRALTEITHQAASPKADPKTRKAAADELTKLLAKDKPDSIQYEVLDLIGYIGGKDQVEAVLALTADEDPLVAEEALRVLDRIPDPAATAALVSLLKPDDSPEKQTRILKSLAHRADPGAIEAVQAFYEQATGKVKVEALDTLSHLGWRFEGSMLRLVLGLGERVERETLGVIRLRLAANDLAAGDKAKAEKEYVDLTRRGAGEQVQLAAIEALTSLGGPDAISAIIAAVGFPERDVQGQAHKTLVAWKGEEVQKALDEAYSNSGGPQKAGLLGVLAERNPDDVEEKIVAAFTDPAEEVRTKAYELAGKRGDLKHLETLLLAATKERIPAPRHAAQEGYVALGGAAAKSGDAAQAQAVFKNALAFDADFVRWDALLGIASVPSADLAPDVEALLSNEALAEAAAEAYIAIAQVIGEGGDAEKRVEMLWKVVDTPGVGSQRNRAVGILGELGEDISKIPQREGFLNTWHLIGTFPNPDNSAFATAFFPEEKVDLSAGGEVDGNKIEWKKVATGESPAIFNLRNHFDQQQNVAIYAYTEIEASEETPVVLMFGTNDGCVLWVNGDKKFEHEGGRGLTLDGDRVEVTLKKGKNTILLKVLQQGGGWDMVMRVGDPLGFPVDMTAADSKLDALSSTD